MKSREHFIIPDTQVKPGVYIDHLEAAGNYIVDKQPDVIIHLGDHFDMPSLSSYERGTKHAEGARYEEDIRAGKEGLEALVTPIKAENIRRKRRGIKPYKPEMHFCLGNHEERIERHATSNPALVGKLSYDDLGIEEFGFECHDFLEPVLIDGVAYAHYFYHPMSGNAIGGNTHYKLTKLGYSFTMGHQQGKDIASKELTNGKVLRGLVAGSFYSHDERYKGHQGNHHWRGCIYKHEVKDGNYDLMELSIEYLEREWL